MFWWIIDAFVAGDLKAIAELFALVAALLWLLHQ